MGKYTEFFEGNYHVRVLERGKRHSVRVRMPPDENHKSRWYTPFEKVTGSKADALIRCREIEQSILHADEMKAAAEEAERAAMTLNTFIDDVWIPSRSRMLNPKTGRPLSKLTLQRERVDLERLQKTSIAGIPLSRITKADILDAYQELRDTGVSDDAVHKVHMKVRQLLRYARAEHYITINPADDLMPYETPKRVTVTQEKRRIQRITIEQAIKLASILQDETPRNGFIVALFLALTTGMRRGEILGLVWHDVELNKNGGIIHVREQYGKERTRKATKTDASARVVPIGEMTTRFLKDWRKQQQKQFAAGMLHRTDGVRNKRGNTREPVKWTDNTPVCTNDQGSAINPDNLSRWRRQYFVKIGFAHYEHEETYIDANGTQRIRRTGYVGPELHSLRRTHATMLIASGEDPKTVQKRLGHTDVMTTLKAYAEAVTDNEIAAGTHVEKMLDLSAPQMTVAHTFDDMMQLFTGLGADLRSHKREQES